MISPKNISEHSFNLQSQDILPSFDLGSYTLVRLIASSNHKVYLYQTSSLLTPPLVAVKEIFIEEADLTKFEQKLQVIFLAQSTGHPNIVQIYGFSKVFTKLLNGKIVISYLICMEYLPYNLQDRIEYLRSKQQNGYELELILQQLIDAFTYLQQLSYCHTDIKPQNILTDSVERPQIFKVCDFDHMRKFKIQARQQSFNITTSQYQPPEILDAIHQGTYQIHYNPYKSDVYSLGICLVQLAHKIKAPPDTIELFQIWHQETEILLINTYGSLLAQIVMKMVHKQNNLRPDFFSVCQMLTSEGIMQMEKSMYKKTNISLMRSSRSAMTPMQKEIKESRAGTFDMKSRWPVQQENEQSIIRTVSSHISTPVHARIEQQNDNYFSMEEQLRIQEEKVKNQQKMIEGSSKCECPTWVKLVTGITSGVAFLIGLIILFLFLDKKL